MFDEISTLCLLTDCLCEVVLGWVANDWGT